VLSCRSSAEVLGIPNLHLSPWEAELKTGHKKVAQLLFRPARPGREGYFLYKEFFPIEFEDHFGNHQN